MDSSELIVYFAKFIVRTAIGKMRSSPSVHGADHWYCSACKVRL